MEAEVILWVGITLPVILEVDDCCRGFIPQKNTRFVVNFAMGSKTRKKNISKRVVAKTKW
jgi:hypothetical protein